MREYNGNLNISSNPLKNVLRYDEIDYLIKPINSDFSRSKGGNSSVFILFDPQEKTELIVKFSKYDLKDKKIVAFNAERIQRFEREIEALQTAKSAGFEFVINFKFDGNYKIGNKLFRYFVMEKGNYDLTEYLKLEEVSIQQRFLMCTQILKGIKELHSEYIYHRDIKPDNILFVNGICKISDLGLVSFRDDDFESKEIGLKIGPANWMSPEAMNKMYNEGPTRTNTYQLDCKLDEFSDIFQLGKLFWFILQGNIPDGQLTRTDFKIEDDELYNIIYRMLNHSKNRPHIQEIEDRFKSKYSFYGI